MSAVNAVGSSSKPHKAKKSKSKEKTDKSSKKRKDTSARQEEHGRNEGTDTSLEYQPPKGALPADYDVEFGEFDYDAVKEDEEAELWLVRIPDSVKTKHLESVHISVPSSSRAGRVGVVTRKQTAYDIWAVSREGSGGAENAGVGGEEMASMSVLLPRAKKGGKLYLAPKSITRHLIVAAPPPRPTPPEARTAEAVHQTYQNPPRHAYPDELLTHQFLPYGARSRTQPSNAMEVDEGNPDVEVVGKEVESKKSPEKEKGRKRKVAEGESPKAKKVKKTKTAAST